MRHARLATVLVPLVVLVGCGLGGNEPEPLLRITVGPPGTATCDTSAQTCAADVSFLVENLSGTTTPDDVTVTINGIDAVLPVSDVSDSCTAPLAPAGQAGDDCTTTYRITAPYDHTTRATASAGAGYEVATTFTTPGP